MKLLSLSGDNSSARGLQGPHYEMLKEFHAYWERIDIMVPYHKDAKNITLFDNVYFHMAPSGCGARVRWLKSEGLNLLTQHNHHLIAAHDYPPFFNGRAGRFLSQQTNTPHVLEIYHVEGHPFAANFKDIFRRWFTAWYIKGAWKAAAAIRVINKSQVPHWLMAQGVPESKLRLLYSSYTDTQIFKPRESKKKYDIIYVGRLVDHKGLEDILEAAKAIPELRVCFAGTGPLEEKLKAKAHKLGSRVHFTGWLKDSHAISEHINQAKALVCASRSEGGPRTTLEAMACAVPVISTPVGTMKDIIRHQRNGLLIDPSAESLIRAIRYLLAHPEESEAMGLAGKEVALQFEKKNLIREYATGYQALAKK